MTNSNLKIKVIGYSDGNHEVKNIDNEKLSHKRAKVVADEMIKKEIEKSKNPKNLVVITSDTNLKDFARKCSCTIISSEEFLKLFNSSTSSEEESKRIQELENPNEFKKLFGVK